VSSRTPFVRLERSSLTDQVRERLAESITSGALPPGAQIPSEERLCREFGVSRPSVREALRELMALGLVERRGNRAHVVEHFPDVRIEIAERVERVRELFETRRAIEVPLTRHAAERATPAQRAEIVALADQITAVSTLDALRPLDQAFHALVAASAGNALLAELHAKVMEALFNSPRYEGLMNVAHTPASEKRVVRASANAHAAIAAAVNDGDGEAAAVAALEHLVEVESRMVARSRAGGAGIGDAERGASR
jgi:GntR family transcriptional repressor for pyruvate dehydrogenase complex